MQGIANKGRECFLWIGELKDERGGGRESSKTAAVLVLVAQTEATLNIQLVVECLEYTDLKAGKSSCNSANVVMNLRVQTRLAATLNQAR